MNDVLPPLESSDETVVLMSICSSRTDKPWICSWTHFRELAGNMCINFIVSSGIETVVLLTHKK